MLVKHTDDALEANLFRLLPVEKLLGQYPNTLSLTPLLCSGQPDYLLESNERRRLVDAFILSTHE